MSEICRSVLLGLQNVCEKGQVMQVIILPLLILAIHKSKMFFIINQTACVFLFFFLQYVKTQQVFMGMINFFLYVTVT